MTGHLDGQIALITGGASGLGRAVVGRYLCEGARVAVLDRSEADLKQLKDELGDAVVTVQGDVRSYQDNERAVRHCVEAFGKLDVAVGNAGIWDYNRSLVELRPETISEAFDEIFSINVKGYLLLAKAALPALAKSRGGLILTVSNAGFYPAGGGPLYTATKHAVVGLIRQLAYELAPIVRVNGVAPGGIATKLKGPAALGLQDAEFPAAQITKSAEGAVPVGRLPLPDEYAGAYVFFASRSDNFPATGTILNHDGGIGIRGFRGEVGGHDLMSRLGLDL
jgi:NAD(P)-dependent dehydrogenase (short-subunit alcohol dehydrogenase family)